MNKKTLIIIGIVLAIIALGVAAYFAWQNRTKIAEIIPVIGGDQIPPLQEIDKKLNVISSRTVKEYWINGAAASSTISYVAEGGDIIHIGDDGQEELGVNIGNTETASIKPSPDGMALFIQVKGAVEADVIDTREGKTISAFMGVEDAAWGTQTEKIATLRRTSEKSELSDLVIADISKKGAAPQRLVTAFFQKGLTVEWPNQASLFLSQKPSADYISEIWKVDIKTKKIAKFLSDRGLIVQWAPFGTRALKFTTTEGRNHRLTLIDEKGLEVATLKFITLPDKCVMTGSTQMYCAIPRDQAALSRLTLPDDYLKRNVYFQDGIYQIDIANNGIRAIYEDETPIIDATNLTVVKDKIVFINRYDKKLYSLDLQ